MTTKARLSVGQIVHAIHFASTQDQFNEIFSMPYKYAMRGITKVSILEMTVIEHHKVRCSYDDEVAEPKYDGFVLKDQEGRIWHNQYPRAEYGQLSDEGNNIYRLAFEQPSVGAVADYGQLMTALGISYFETRNLGITLVEISRGIIQLAQAICEGKEILAEYYIKLHKLVEVYKTTLDLFEEQNPGKTVQIAPHEKYPEIIQRALVIDKADATHTYFDINNWIELKYMDKLKEAYLEKLKAGGCYEQTVINLEHPNKLKVCFNDDQLVLVYCHGVWEGDDIRDIGDNTNLHNAESIDAFIAELLAVVVR